MFLTHNIVVGDKLFLGFKFLKVNLVTEITCTVVAIIASIAFAAIMYELIEKLSIQLN